MPFPLAAVGAGLAAGGVAGSIFGKKKLPKFDIGQINQLIKEGGQEERNTLARLRPETDAQLKQFETGVNTSQAAAKTAREAERTRYLSELDPVTSRLLQAQTDQLKRTTFGAIPEAQQATREALAASGGLGRGVAAESLARVPQEAARAFSEGASGLQQESLRTMQDALANLQSQESQAIARDLGIDQETYQTILSTGNAALVAELNGLIEESRNRTSGLVSAEQFRQTGNVGAVAGHNAENAALFGGIANLGGNLLGMGTAPKLQEGVEDVPTTRRRAVRSSLAGGGTATA